MKVLLILPVAFFVYWFVSIFLFLFKKTLYGKFTSVIQRFWKRTLYLFWGLELFLFSIFLFLVLNCASEVEWLFDQPQLFKSYYINCVSFFLMGFIVLVPVLLLTVLQYFSLHYSHFFKNITVVFLLALTTLLLLEEFYQVFLTSVFYTDSTLVFNKEKVFWGWDDSHIKRRTIQHHYFLLLVLKFWHVAFIYGMLLLSSSYYSSTGFMFQGLLSSNRQNMLFLVMFNFVMFFGVFKHYMNVSFYQTYGWFLTHNMLNSPIKFVSPINLLSSLC